MTEKELFNLLSTLDMPVAYDHFLEAPQGTTVQPPFILYKVDDTITFKADDKVYSKNQRFVINLVTDLKDVDLEGQMEDLLNSNHLPFDKVEIYIQAERIFQISYYI